MKIIAIGDIHGKRVWKDIISKESDADRIVFIGDYFDNYEMTTHHEQIENLKEILYLKQMYPDKYICLVGNHDISYILGEKISGYQNIGAIDIKEVIQIAINNNLLQMCHIEEDYLFSHAGVTKTWCIDNEVDPTSLQESINDLLKYKPQSFRFYGIDPYGNDVFQSPVWVRPESLLKDKIESYKQVVGHTRVKELVEFRGVTFIDTLDTTKEYFKLEI